MRRPPPMRPAGDRRAPAAPLPAWPASSPARKRSRDRSSRPRDRSAGDPRRGPGPRGRLPRAPCSAQVRRMVESSCAFHRQSGSAQCLGSLSVACHRRLDFAGPQFDAAREVEDVAESRPLQQRRRIAAAVPVVTHDHERSVVRESRRRARQARRAESAPSPRSGNTRIPTARARRSARAAGVSGPSASCAARRGPICGIKIGTATATKAFTSGSITVSKRSSSVTDPAATQRIIRAAIAGASPTTAKTRPPGFNCLTKASGRIGVDPVSTIAS